MSLSHHGDRIERELAAARAAAEAGNEGMTRVCARRAAGVALEWFLSRHPRAGWRTDAMSLLRAMSGDESFSPAARAAAARLSAKVTQESPYGHTRPIEDALIIIAEIRSLMP